MNFLPQSKRKNSSQSNPAMAMLALIITLLMLAPIFWVFLISLKSSREIFQSPPTIFPEDPTADNWEQLFEIAPLTAQIGNSLVKAGISAVVAVAIGTVTAYGLAVSRLQRQGEGLLYVVLSSRFVPPMALAIPALVLLREIDLLDNPVGVIIFNITLVMPFALIIMRDYFLMMPREIWDAGQVDGANLGEMFRLIALRYAYPALGAALMVCFVFSWNEFAYSNLFLRSAEFSLTVGHARLTGAFAFEMGVLAASASLLILPPIILSLIFSRYVFTGISLGIVREEWDG